jgi:hypothetical protein
VQAADFLIKEAAEGHTYKGVRNEYADSLLDSEADLFLATKKRAGR